MENGDQDPDLAPTPRGKQIMFPISLDGFHIDGGLHIREYFAAMAMQGILAGSIRVGDVAGKNPSGQPKDIAFLSVSYADALLLALEGGTPNS